MVVTQFENSSLLDVLNVRFKISNGSVVVIFFKDIIKNYTSSREGYSFYACRPKYDGDECPYLCDLLFGDEKIT